MRPVIGITMGDPVGIGPEIILSALSDPEIYDICRPVVFGDARILGIAGKILDQPLRLSIVTDPKNGAFQPGQIDLIEPMSAGDGKTVWGRPTVETGRAMTAWIEAAADMAMEGKIAAMVTAPINKTSMRKAGYQYNGHTELLSERTRAKSHVMMMAGDRLRVSLATIHTPLKRVPEMLSTALVLRVIQITDAALKTRFGIAAPAIAVAGLNPHAGEQGMFGDEEARIIEPATRQARDMGVNASGPFPPDTLFYYAAKKKWDAVVCMYHDQGLIPFKLLHFEDGVNTTLGLPIIRTSVDHGTAYDIAGKGAANPNSLVAAIKMAADQARAAATFDAGVTP